MSIHPSLSSSTKNKKQKSVLKRAERLKLMLEKGTWHEGDSVFGLPKIKTVRIKIKKEKAAEKPVVEGAAGAVATPTDTTAQTVSKTQAAPKTQKTAGGQSTK
jgi:small basic protein (TIGR04137 family)